MLPPNTGMLRDVHGMLGDNIPGRNPRAEQVLRTVPGCYGMFQNPTRARERNVSFASSCTRAHAHV